MIPSTTGAAIFSENSGPGRRPPPANQRPMGDDYRPPVGLPEWKQPSYDEDDRVDPVSVPAPRLFVGNRFADGQFRGRVDQSAVGGTGRPITGSKPRQ